MEGHEQPHYKSFAEVCCEFNIDTNNGNVIGSEEIIKDISSQMGMILMSQRNFDEVDG